jgi:hypothetical protein
MGAQSDMRATQETPRKETAVIGAGRSAMLAVAALSVLVYLPSFRVGFLADDYVMLQTLDRLSWLSILTHHDIGGSDGHFYRPMWLLWDRLMLALPPRFAT